MSKAKDGGPAFARPRTEWKNFEGYPFVAGAQEGMTVRQYYKAKLAPVVLSDLAKSGSFTFEYLANTVGDIADALIAEDEEFEKRGGDDA